jgi:hypothetical protein
LIPEITILNTKYDENNDDFDDDLEDDDESIESTSTKYIKPKHTLDLENDSNNNNDNQNEIINENNSSNIFKHLNISGLNLGEEISDKQNYKNLPIQKLRTIVVQKGLINDSSKLKKNDILKMLESE